MTYSIAAVCHETGEIGYAVATSSVCVGARVGAVLPGRCVVFSQARTDPRLHQIGMNAFATSGDVATALQAMQDKAFAPHWRQLGILSHRGEASFVTGASCMSVADGQAGRDCLALGNALGSPAVVPAMVQAAETATGPLADRLVAALRAGELAGSEVDPLQSASLRVFGEQTFATTDLRIDKSDDPIADLAALLADWAPKAGAYITRALDPDAAPPSSEVEHANPV